MSSSLLPDMPQDLASDHLSLIPKIFGPLETVLGMTGMGSPFRRFVVFSSIATAIEFYLKPAYAYDANGGIKKIAYFTDQPGATYFFPGFFPMIIGAFTALYL